MLHTILVATSVTKDAHLASLGLSVTLNVIMFPANHTGLSWGLNQMPLMK